jgi:hypothetical protein
MEKLFEINEDLNDIEAKFKILEETKETYNKWQSDLDVQPTLFENLEELREAYSMRCLMWRSLDEWEKYIAAWYETQFAAVDDKEIEKLAAQYFKNCMKIEKTLDPNPIQEKLKFLVTQFKEAMPIVSALRNEQLTAVHWTKIKNLIKKDFDIADEKFTLKSLIDLDVNQFQEEITTIST